LPASLNLIETLRGKFKERRTSTSDALFILQLNYDIDQLAGHEDYLAGWLPL